MDKSIYNKHYRQLITLLREKREEKGITQLQLAEKLSISQGIISKIETYERRIDIIELRNIYIALNIPFIEFIEEMENNINNYPNITTTHEEN